MKYKEANLVRVVDAVENLTKILIEENVIKGNKWHTIDFYARKYKKGNRIDEFRVSSIKRDLRGELLELKTQDIEKDKK